MIPVNVKPFVSTTTTVQKSYLKEESVWKANSINASHPPVSNPAYDNYAKNNIEIAWLDGNVTDDRLNAVNLITEQSETDPEKYNYLVQVLNRLEEGNTGNKFGNKSIDFEKVYSYHQQGHSLDASIIFGLYSTNDLGKVQSSGTILDFQDIDSMDEKQVREALLQAKVVGSWYPNYLLLGKAILTLLNGRYIPNYNVPIDWVNNYGKWSGNLELLYVNKIKDFNKLKELNYVSNKDMALNSIENHIASKGIKNNTYLEANMYNLFTYLLSAPFLLEQLDSYGLTGYDIYNYDMTYHEFCTDVEVFLDSTSNSQVDKNLLIGHELQELYSIYCNNNYTISNTLTALKAQIVQNAFKAGGLIGYDTFNSNTTYQNLAFQLADYLAYEASNILILSGYDFNDIYNLYQVGTYNTIADLVNHFLNIQHNQYAQVNLINTDKANTDPNRMTVLNQVYDRLQAINVTSLIGNQNIDFEIVYSYFINDNDLDTSILFGYFITNNLNLSRKSIDGSILFTKDIDTMSVPEMKVGLEESDIVSNPWWNDYVGLAKNLLKMMHTRYIPLLPYKVPISWIKGASNYGTERAYIMKLRDKNGWNIAPYPSNTLSAQWSLNKLVPYIVKNHLELKAGITRFFLPFLHMKKFLEDKVSDPEKIFDCSAEFLYQLYNLDANHSIFNSDINIEFWYQAYRLSGKPFNEFIPQTTDILAKIEALAQRGYNIDGIPSSDDEIALINTLYNSQGDLSRIVVAYQVLVDMNKKGYLFEAMFKKIQDGLQLTSFENYMQTTYGIIINQFNDSSKDIITSLMDYNIAENFNLIAMINNPVNLSKIEDYYNKFYSYNDGIGTYNTNFKAAFLLAYIEKSNKAPLNSQGNVTDVIFFIKNLDYIFATHFILKNMNIKPSEFFTYSQTSELDSLPTLWVKTKNAITHTTGDLALPQSLIGGKGEYWLPLWKYEAKNKVGNPPPVVLIHGLFANRDYLDPKTVEDIGLPDLGIPAPSDKRVSLEDERYSLRRYLQNRGRDTWVAELRGCGKYSLFSLYLALAKTAHEGKIPSFVPGWYLEYLTTDNPDRAKELYDAIHGNNWHTTPEGQEYVKTKREYEYSIDDHIHEDFPAIVAGILKADNKSKIQVVGHSLGGIITVGALPQSFIANGKNNIAELESGQSINLPVNPIKSVITLGSGFTFNQLPPEVYSLQDMFLYYARKLGLQVSGNTNPAPVVATLLSGMLGPNISRTTLSQITLSGRNDFAYIEHQGAQGSTVLSQMAYWPNTDMHYYSASGTEPSYIDQYDGSDVIARGPDGNKTTFMGYQVNIPIAFVSGEGDGIGHVENIRPLLRKMNIVHGKIIKGIITDQYPELFQDTSENYTYFKDKLDDQYITGATIAEFKDSALLNLWQTAKAEEQSVIKRYKFPDYYRAEYNNGHPTSFMKKDGQLEPLKGFSHGLVARGIMDKNVWQDLNDNGVPNEFSNPTISEKVTTGSKFIGFDEKSVPNFNGNSYDMSGANESSFEFIERKLDEEME